MNLSPLPIQKFFDNNGRPLTGGLLFTYAAGTNTKIATYQDQAGTPNTNPVVLNYRGEANVWLDQTLTYKFVLARENDTDPPTNPIWSVDNISAAVTFASLTQQIIGQILYPRTAAEINAGVTPTNYWYPPLDIRRYGGDPTGLSASDAALTSAIAVCGTNGGTILFPGPGGATYLFNNSINLSVKRAIILQGDGAATGGASDATTLTYAGTGASPWISMDSSAGVQIRNMMLRHTNGAFTGAMVKIGNSGAGDSSFCGLIDVVMDAGSNTAYHLDLDKAIECEFIRVNFAGGAVSVKGQNSSGTSYSNAMRFELCQWLNAAAPPVLYGGQSWVFDTCSFEQLANGRAGAFDTNPGVTAASGLTFTNCWFGDATVDGGKWVRTFSQGFNFHGNYVSTLITPSSATTIGIELLGSSGADISGNDFVNLGTALNLATTASAGLVFQANSFLTVATQIGGSATFGHGPSSVVNPNNPLVASVAPFFNAGTQGWEYTANGLLEIWGVKNNVVSGVGAVLTYTTEVPNFPGFSAVYNFQLGHAPANPATFFSPWGTFTGTTVLNVNASGGGGTGNVYWRVLGKG